MLLRDLSGCSDPKAPVESLNMQNDQYERTKQTLFYVVLSFLTLSGICPVNKNTIDYLLSQNGTGNAVIIVIGGAAESLQCTAGMNSVTLKNRKGFVRLALQKG